MHRSALVLLFGAAWMSCAAALTRAEIIERFRAAPATMCDGLVQVWADCPREMRREYQLPIAGFAADVCRALSASEKVRLPRFERPGVVIHIGDVATNDATVVARVVRDSEGAVLKIWIPAPGYADMRAVRIAVARGWFLAAKGTDPGGEGAWNALVDADPEMRLAAEIADLVAWRTKGVYARGRTDEDYLRLQRRILRPGFCSPAEALTFASRLVLYPPYDDCLFAGRYDRLEFREAIRYAKDDLLVRIAALRKSDRVIVWGGGRGERLDAAAMAYSDFLRALARGNVEEAELERMLDAADAKLKEVLE